MLSRRSALVAAAYIPVLGACAASPGAIETVPLPSDMKITFTPPGPDVPPQIAAFWGKWSGQWNYRWSTSTSANFYVEKVNADGSAQVVYAYYSGWDVRGGATRYTDARISNGVMTLTSTGLAKYRLLSNGQLQGDRQLSNGDASIIIMTKVKT